MNVRFSAAAVRTRVSLAEAKSLLSGTVLREKVLLPPRSLVIEIEAIHQQSTALEFCFCDEVARTCVRHQELEALVLQGRDRDSCITVDLAGGTTVAFEIDLITRQGAR